MKKYIIILTLVALGAAGFWLWKSKKGGQEKKEEVKTYVVERGEIVNKVLSTGVLKPYTRVELRSSVKGRVEEIKVKEGDIVKKGEVVAWVSSEDRISLLDAARASYEQAKQSQDAAAIKLAEEEMEVAKRSYALVPIISPINGEVIRRSVEPGQNLFDTTALFILSDKLIALVEVDEADIGHIQIGQKAKIKLESFPDELRLGQVIQIAREGSTVNNVTVYDVTVVIDKIPKKWAAEMTANVEFIIQEKKDILVVPVTALKERKNRKFVVLAQTEERRFRPVETGITDNNMIEIVEGLEEGEEIIISDIKGRDSKKRNSKDRDSMMRNFRRMNRR